MFQPIIKSNSTHHEELTHRINLALRNHRGYFFLPPGKAQSNMSSLDSLSNPVSKTAQLQAELRQMQFRLAQTKAKVDSLQTSIQQRAVAHSDQYWLRIIRCGEQEQTQTSAQFIADLQKDQLIKSEKGLHSYHLDQKIFKVNGNKQSPEITQKYQQKYLSRKPNGDQTTSMAHTQSGFLGLNRWFSR